MFNVVNDCRLAARTIRRSPSYGAVAILTLALAIGANTLIFSIANPLVVRTLPVADPGSLGWLSLENPAREISRGALSAPDFLDLRARATTFRSLASLRYSEETLIAPGADPERVTAVRASANLPAVWGLTPLRGRLLAEGDDAPNRETPIVLGDRYWRVRFAADPQVLGQRVFLNGKNAVVVGVMPPSIELGNIALVDVWAPDTLDPNGSRDARTLRVMGRLAPGATLASASAEIAVLHQALVAAYPGSHQGWVARVVDTRTATLGRNTKLVLALLGIVVGFVLLIACANLTNLVFARLNARALEQAVRQALGASRWQLVRPFVIEALLLSAAGGAAGVALASAGLRAIRAVAYEPIFQQLTIDGNVLLFASGLVLLAPVLFCALPLVWARRGASADTLRHARTGGGTRARRQRHVLVAGQVALALSLLIVSTLAVKSMLYLNGLPLGIDLARTAMFKFEVPADDYPDDGAVSRFEGALESALAGTGGVTAAAVVSHLPVFDNESSRAIGGLSRAFPADAQPWASWYAVSPGFFQASGVRIVAGRGFDVSDRIDAESTAVLNRAAVVRYFGEPNDAIGRRVTVADGAGAPRSVIVIGVSTDTASPALLATDPQVYVPLAQWPQRQVTAIVASPDISRRLADLRAAVRALAPRMPITELRTLGDRQRDEMSSNVILNGLFVSFALLAMLLAAGGLYGVIAYSVGQRAREIGVRMALGAQPSGIRRMVLGDGLKVTLTGVAAGLLLGLGMAKLAAPIVEGVTPTDPITFAGVAGAVMAVALLSILGPATRAMRVDPARTLRGD